MAIADDEAGLDPPMGRLALERALFIVGEAASGLPENVRDAIDQPWPDIIGLRHVLAHRYEAVEVPQLLRTARDHVPALIAAVQAYLERR